MSESGHVDQNDNNVIEIEPLNQAPSSGDLMLSANDDDAPSDRAEAKRARKGSGVWIVVSGGVIALLWSAGALAYLAGLIGFSALPDLPPLQIASLVFAALGPAIFVMVLAWVIREIVLFGAAARSIQGIAERFADPAKATREDARALANAVQVQILQMNKSVEGALARLGAMEEVLGHHADAFHKTEAHTRERTDSLINDLRREREAVGELADQLDTKAADIAKVIAEQSKMVVSAADIANSQTIAGTKALGRASDRLQDTVERAKTNADLMSEQLNQSAGRIDGSARAMADARQNLETTASNLDASQIKIVDALGVSKEDIQGLVDVSEHCTAQLKGIAEEGAKTMRQTMEETLDQARHYTSIMREEGHALSNSHTQKAKDLKNAADEAKNALDTYAEAISRRLEHANEASFSAASWADKTLEKLQEATSALGDQLQSLPKAADDSAREIETKLRGRLAGLNAAAAAASEEAKGIDVAFQSRIRQNYELLSDFMHKMGATAAPASAEIDVPNPLSIKADPTPISQPQVLVEEPTLPITDEPAADPVQPQETHSATDTEAPSGNKDTWRWRDVLSRIDQTQSGIDARGDDSKPQQWDPVDRLVAMFRDMGIQPDQLFDATSYRAAALSRMTDGAKAMADVARVDATKSVKRIADAFIEDPGLRADALHFTAELRHKVDQAAASGQQMHIETHLRTGDGPAYLLLEAALQS
ncbi:MAG: hypothetical protein COA47_09680 [Robiginitomaculum sp.]|nr:MAG: hypothetical protein COA47_09680 [Robiginitomaculum sp.]